jgi:uncharacterized protein YndB with AHSA1/START domain
MKETMDSGLTVEESVEISKGVDEVWAVFADFERWSHWNPVCREVIPLSGRLFEPEATFEMRLTDGEVSFIVRAVVLEHQPPSRVVWVGSNFGITGRHEFRFEVRKGRVLATAAEEFSGPNLPLGRSIIERSVPVIFRRWLEALKAEVEKVG